MKYIRCFNCDKPIYTDEEIKIGIVVECPHCGEKTNIFGQSQGEKFATDMGVVYLGNLPLTEQVPESANQDSTMVNSYADSEVSQKFSEIIDNIKLAFLDDD